MSRQGTEMAHCCLRILRILGLIYEICGVVFLVKDYHVAKLCPASHMWVYVLVSLLLESAAMNTLYMRQSEPSAAASLCYAVGAAAMAIWGGYELIAIPCLPLMGKHLQGFAVATFILQALSAIGAVVGCVGGRILNGDTEYASMV